MEYGESVYINQAKMELLEEELAEFVAKKFDISTEAGEYVLILLHVDKLRGDEYEPGNVQLLEEIKRVKLAW